MRKHSRIADVASEPLLSRRAALQVAAGSAATALLSAVPGFREAFASDRAQPAVVMQGQTRNCILVIFTGGMSSLDSFDHKPDAVESVRGPFRPIRTRTRQAVFSSQFPQLADIDDKFGLMTAMRATSSGSHQTAYVDWLNALRNERRQRQHIFEPQLRGQQGIPYVEMVTPGVRPLMEPERRELLLNRAISLLWDDQRNDLVSTTDMRRPERLEERVQLRNQLNALSTVSGEQVEMMEQHYRTAVRIITNGLVNAFDDEDPAVGRSRMRRYGDHPYGRIFSLAGKLADPAVGNANLVVIETGDWDHHWDLEQRFRIRAPHMDQAMRALIEEYGDRLVIAARGEFGRSPVPEVHRGHSDGRGHDARHAGLIAGPSIRSGVKYGVTDPYRIQSEATSDAAFAYTLLEATGAIPRRASSPSIKELLRPAA